MVVGCNFTINQPTTATTTLATTTVSPPCSGKQDEDGKMVVGCNLGVMMSTTTAQPTTWVPVTNPPVLRNPPVTAAPTAPATYRPATYRPATPLPPIVDSETREEQRLGDLAN